MPVNHPTSQARTAQQARSAISLMRSAFTLIELLVVVAIIALLISILLPSLGLAREQARTVVCGQRLRDFGTGLGAYTAENRDYIPGLNTSGVAVRARNNLAASFADALYDGKLPVQSYDWITPILTGSVQLPAVRAERFKTLLDQFRCASQREISIPYPQSSGADRPDWAKYTPYAAVSYLMPAYFQFMGQAQQDAQLRLAPQVTANPTATAWVVARAARANWEVRMDDFVPLVTRLGPPARKVFAADGTRYLPAGNMPLDHDMSPDPDSVRGVFGSFTCSGGWWSGSTAWGVGAGTTTWDGATVNRASPSNGRNLALSYRHGGAQASLNGDARANRGAMNAVFFDGHVQRMSDRESREIYLWYPSGGRVQTATEGMTNVPEGFVIP